VGPSDERSTPVLTAMPGRRDFLRGIALTGAAATAGSLLAGCSGGSTGSKATPSTAGKPRRGGNLKVGLAGGSTSDTLDPHQGLTYLDTGRF
jgi:peptide/nickel transport system substrate-binding protein